MFSRPHSIILDSPARWLKRERAHFVRLCISLCALFACMLLLHAPTVLAQAPQAAPQSPQPAAATPPSSVPASRAAQNVAVITIHGPIDQWTARSVARRITEAEQSGAGAIVFDIDTPGGEMGAMLVISTAIKRSRVPVTVAWINPNAYSAGCVIALACSQMIFSDGAALGDALPIALERFMGIKKLGDAEREKILGPVMADIIDSARRNGYDEMLVQGFIRRGVELWLVEHSATGQRLFVTREQYIQAVGSEPTSATPTMHSITGPIDPLQKPAANPQLRPQSSKAGAPGFSPNPAQSSPRERPARSLPTDPSAQSTPRESDQTPPADDPTTYQPAAPDMARSVAGEVSTQLSLLGSKSTRPDLSSPEHKGKYVLIEYVADGKGVLTLRQQELTRYALVQDRVNSQQDLAAYFGARNVAVLEENFSERGARLLSNDILKLVLLVVFLVALFIEMTHPGVILPGIIAALCLIGLVLPPLLVSLWAWWAVGAVLVGIVLIAVELFLTPGLVIFGVAGSLLLLGGLVGVFAGGPQALFPNSQQDQGNLFISLATVLGAIVVAGGIMMILVRNLPHLPLFTRFILKDPNLEDSGALASSVLAMSTIAPGTLGVAITTLRPSGRVKIDGQVVDAVADNGFINPGTPIRVLSSDSFRTVVEPAGSQA